MKSPNKQASEGAKSSVSGLTPTACADRLAGHGALGSSHPDLWEGTPLTHTLHPAGQSQHLRAHVALEAFTLKRRMTLPLTFQEPKPITQPFLTFREWGWAQRRTKNIWQIALRTTVHKGHKLYIIGHWFFKSLQ